MARKTALEILIRYEKEGSYLNILLNDRLKQNHLSRKDKDLVTRLVYGTIQNKLYLEYLLEPYIKDKKVKTKERMLLLMSLYQLNYLDKIPEYAIIHEAVALCKNQYTKKFINAILRNYTRNPKRSIDDLDPLKRLSIETSHPFWMVAMLKKQYGFSITKKICEENNDIPTLAARVNTLKTSKAALLEDKELRPGYISEDAILFSKGNIASSTYFKQGLVTIQDESSQLVAHFLHPRPNQKVLDMCCAPGSKTSHLAAIMENTGEIIACDLFEHKIKLVKDNNRRLGVKNVTCYVQDATKLKDVFSSQSFDRILLDAPCSGLGVLKRKPEIKYHDSNVMDELIPLQLKLLENAYYLLKKNGRMVYSTCTLNKKENTGVIQQFLKKHPDMEIIEEKTIFPYLYHSDGFYMCKLKKESNYETII